MDSMNWPTIYPQLALLCFALVIALADLWLTDEHRTTTYWLTQSSLAVVAGIYLYFVDLGVTQEGMQGMVVSDPMGNLLGTFACIATMIALAYARPYALHRELLKGELFVLALFSLLGISVMLSANNFLVIYLGLELMSLSLYALTALRRDHSISTEAAMKYFVLGALASGFLLYGLSMMYGATGSLDIDDVFKAIGSGQINWSVLIFGLVFLVAGLAFKLGAAPFHMWVPDIYQGAPTAVTLLIGGAPKLAAFAIMIRLLVDGLYGLAVEWQQMLIVLSLSSMVLGNLAAIAQTNIKRMLAYSTIAHMGFMLLGMTTGVAYNNAFSMLNSYSSSMFYMVTYVLTTLGTLGMVMLLSRRGFESEHIDDFKGLARRSPWFAAVMAIFMFSLAGIPPTVGFYAKLSILQALISTNLVGYWWLAGSVVLLSLIGAYYYLRIVKLMFFDEPRDTATLSGPGEVRVLMSLNGVAVIALGLMPGGLMAWCAQVISQSFGS